VILAPSYKRLSLPIYLLGMCAVQQLHGRRSCHVFVCTFTARLPDWEVSGDERATSYRPVDTRQLVTSRRKYVHRAEPCREQRVGIPSSRRQWRWTGKTQQDHWTAQSPRSRLWVKFVQLRIVPCFICISNSRLLGKFLAITDFTGSKWSYVWYLASSKLFCYCNFV